MYVITAHQRHGRTDGQTDGRTDVKRSHDRYIAKACSGKNVSRRAYLM